MPLLPSYLEFKAKDFEDWAESISARSRFAVLLRTLVHSTGLQISAANFPGNDESERPGWDGFVEAGEATAWVPLGKSGWEFGINKDFKSKANKDYDKSVKHLPPEERADITFVFVTLRGWKDKNKWMCTAPGFSDTRQRYAASCVVIVAAIHVRLVSPGLR